jgi:hypothetical protein
MLLLLPTLVRSPAQPLERGDCGAHIVFHHLPPVDAAKKIRDEQLSSSEPLKVENRGAWSMLAKKETPNGTPLPQSTADSSSSLWLSARSMEQIKQQKIQQKEKERTVELEALKRREAELREKEKEREVAERRKQEQEQAAKLAEEKRSTTPP